MTKDDVLALALPVSNSASMTSGKAATASENASVLVRSKSEEKLGPRRGHSEVGWKVFARVSERVVSTLARVILILRYIVARLVATV